MPIPTCRRRWSRSSPNGPARGRGSGTVDHRARRSGNERHPAHDDQRSISLYGLSDVHPHFRDGTDNYFARQQVFERIADLSLPTGVTPSVAPLFSPSGLIYRYVLQSPDRSPMELKTIEDWIVERQYKSVPGVADDSGLGGETMQYQVLLRSGEDRRRRTVGPAGRHRAGRQQRQRRRRILFAGRPVLLRARPGPVAHAGGHRQRGAGGPQWHSRSGQRTLGAW
jgi:hypothetical protein